MQFSSAMGTLGGGIRSLQKFLPEIAQSLYVFRFGQPDPQGLEIAKYWFCRPFWPGTALGTPGRKTEKRNFPVLEALSRKKSGCLLQNFLPEIAQLFYCLCFG